LTPRLTLGTPSRMVTLALDSRHDADELADRYAREGRVTIDGVIEHDSALELHRMLRAREDWRQVIITGEKLVELDRPTQASLTPEQREALDQAVYAGARSGFQARYEAIRVPDGADARGASDDPLARFAEWLSGGMMRDFVRTVTGAPDMAFADAQGTAYSPGDFLTGHDDAVAGKSRLAAYVFGLTPIWKIEWGGLLLFHEDAETRASAIAPGFNQLNIFRVGQQHSVSEVTRAAAYRRYSVTGWLRR
jgi:Rps23 Pro-64 3,4-dihydroxylase Tpa1-like proline 4-hydroxylase